MERKIEYDESIENYLEDKIKIEILMKLSKEELIEKYIYRESELIESAKLSSTINSIIAIAIAIALIVGTFIFLCL